MLKNGSLARGLRTDMTVVGATPRNLDHSYNLDTRMWPPFRTDDAKHVFEKLLPRHTYLLEQNLNCGLPRRSGRRACHPPPPARPCPRFLQAPGCASPLTAAGGGRGPPTAACRRSRAAPSLGEVPSLGGAVAYGACRGGACALTGRSWRGRGSSGVRGRVGVGGRRHSAGRDTPPGVVSLTELVLVGVARDGRRWSLSTTGPAAPPVSSAGTICCRSVRLRLVHFGRFSPLLPPPRCLFWATSLAFPPLFPPRCLFWATRISFLPSPPLTGACVVFFPPPSASSLVPLSGSRRAAGRGRDVAP